MCGRFQVIRIEGATCTAAAATWRSFQFVVPNGVASMGGSQAEGKCNLILGSVLFMLFAR